MIILKVLGWGGADKFGVGEERYSFSWGVLFRKSMKTLHDCSMPCIIWTSSGRNKHGGGLSEDV